MILLYSPIPGNTSSVNKTINQLYLKGVKVFTNKTYDIHSSGHAKQEELKLMIRLFKPEFFAPYHGEYRMLKTHTDVAKDCGIPKQNTFVLENGDVLSITKKGIRKNGKVQADDIFVDGSRIGGVGNVIIKDRKLMSTNGILAIIANIDSSTKTLLSTPSVTTRGYILVNENEELIREIQKKAEYIISKKLKDKKFNFMDLKNEIITELMPILSTKIGRVPIILPIIMDINKNKTSNEN